MAIEFGSVIGKWSEAAKWVGGKEPTEGDDVVFGSTSAECAISAEAKCRSLDLTNYKSTLSVAALQKFRIGTTTSNGGKILTLGSEAKFSALAAEVLLVSTSGVVEEITTNGCVNSAFVKMETGGKYKFADKYASTRELAQKGGTWETNGQTVEVESLNVQGAATTIWGTSQIILTGASSEVLRLTGTTLEASPPCCVEIAGTGESEKFCIVTSLPATLRVAADNFVFKELTEVTNIELHTRGKTAKGTSVKEAFTITITGNLTSNGTSAEKIKLKSTVGTKAFKIKKTRGTVFLDGVELQDSTAEGGATFIVRNGTSVSNNTVWTFESPSEGPPEHFGKGKIGFYPGGTYPGGFVTSSITVFIETLSAKMTASGAFAKTLKIAQTFTAKVTASGALAKSFAIAKKLTAMALRAQLAAGNETPLAHENVEYVRRGNTAASQFTPLQQGLVENIAFHTTGGSSPTSITVGIYEDSGNKPGAVLTEKTISGPATSGWNEISGFSVTLEANTKYWLAVHPVGDRINLSLREESGILEHSSGTGETAPLPTGGFSGHELIGPLDMKLFGPGIASLTAKKVISVIVEKLEAASMKATATMTKTFTLPRTFTASLTATGVFAKAFSIAHTLTASLKPTGSLSQLLSLLLAAASMKATATMSKAFTLSRTLTASMTSTGLIAKVLTMTKTFPASITPSGLLTKAFTLARTFTASVTPTALFAKILTIAKTFTASITPTGLLTKALTILRTLTASIKPTFAALGRNMFNWLFTASVKPAATLKQALTITKTFLASVTPASTFSKVLTITKTFTASIKPVAALFKVLEDTIRLTASMMPTASFSKTLSIAKTFIASIKPTSTLSRVVTLALAASVKATATLTKALTIAKTFTASVTPTSLFTKILTMSRTLTAEIKATSTMTKVLTMAKTFTAKVATTSTFLKALTISRTFTASIKPTFTSLTKLLTKAFEASVKPTVTFQKVLSIVKTFVASIKPTAILIDIQEGIIRLTAEMRAVATMTKSFVLPRLFTASTTLTSSFTKAFTVARTFTASIKPTSLFSKVLFIAKAFTASVTATSTFTKAFTFIRKLTAEVKATGEFIKHTFSEKIVALVASVQPTASLTKAFTVTRILTASVQASAALTKAFTFTRTFVASLRPTGLLTKPLISQLLRASMTMTGSLSKTVTMTLKAAIATTGSLIEHATQRVILLVASIQVKGTLSRTQERIVKILKASLDFTVREFPPDIYFAFRKVIGTVIQRLRLDYITVEKEKRRVGGFPTKFEEVQINEEEKEVDLQSRFVLDRDPDSTKG